jgi:MFS family permease
VLFGIGQGAIMPAIPFSARDLGASLAVAGSVVAVLGIGSLVGTVPAGQLVARVGEKRAMLLAAGVSMGASVLCILASTVPVLFAGVAIIGLANAVFGLARHAYLTEAAPLHLRARALSTLAGMHRVGVFAGPFLGAVAIKFFGTDGAYGIFVISAAVVVVVLLALPDVKHAASSANRESTLHVIRRHLPVLRTVGMGVVVLSAVRASRQAVIPLWADHIGIDPATTSVIVGVAGAVDMALFYPAGWIMDRIGRRWTAVPCLAILGLAHVLIPLSGTAATLTAVAVLMGVGDGIGSGIVMTLGSDASPETGRAVFLGAWRLCGTTGSTVGPLILSGITAISALGPAAIVMGAIAGLGAGAMSRWVSN